MTHSYCKYLFNPAKDYLLLQGGGSWGRQGSQLLRHRQTRLSSRPSGPCALCVSSSLVEKVALHGLTCFYMINLFSPFFIGSFNQLDLPAYETYDKLRSMLNKAVDECPEGFGLA